MAGIFGRWRGQGSAGGTGEAAKAVKPQGAAGALVKDATTASFAADVIAESARQPVLADFWAPWCEPCKQLAPVLEKIVKAAGSKVKLVRMNIDDHPEIPGRLGVRSIPAVIAFQRGQPVDGFMGALPAPLATPAAKNPRHVPAFLWCPRQGESATPSKCPGAKMRLRQRNRNYPLPSPHSRQNPYTNGPMVRSQLIQTKQAKVATKQRAKRSFARACRIL